LGQVLGWFTWLRILWVDGGYTGDAAPNMPKWFAAVEIIRLAVDQDWLHKVIKESSKYWRNRRDRRMKLALSPCRNRRIKIGCRSVINICRELQQTLNRGRINKDAVGINRNIGHAKVEGVEQHPVGNRRKKSDRVSGVQGRFGGGTEKYCQWKK
jgi:hypothetical protein